MESLERDASVCFAGLSGQYSSRHLGGRVRHPETRRVTHSRWSSAKLFLGFPYRRVYATSRMKRPRTTWLELREMTMGTIGCLTLAIALLVLLGAPSGADAQNASALVLEKTGTTVPEVQPYSEIA